MRLAFIGARKKNQPLRCSSATKAGHKEAHMSLQLGNTLVVANPAAHSGDGAKAARVVAQLLQRHPEAIRRSHMELTSGPTDATGIAANAGGYDTVVAVGGDGVIHEVVNGLMQLGANERPRLGIVPVGSGNDFARTLGVRRGSPTQAFMQLLHGYERTVELGRVNGTFFCQTLSFGLDAAIALDTTARRRQDDHQRGAGLFATSGMRIFGRDLTSWPFRASFDGEVVEGVDVVFAVQNGPTYGGGFRVCPQADPTDGHLDVCYSARQPSVPHTLLLFLLARNGHHTHSDVLRFRKVRHLDLEFPQGAPPCQVDGEPLPAPSYCIDVVPHVLRVIYP